MKKPSLRSYPPIPGLTTEKTLRALRHKGFRKKEDTKSEKKRKKVKKRHPPGWYASDAGPGHGRGGGMNRTGGE